MQLLSAYGIRQIIVQIFIRKKNNYNQLEAQIKYKHKERQNDILRKKIKKLGVSKLNYLDDYLLIINPSRFLIFTKYSFDGFSIKR